MQVSASSSIAPSWGHVGHAASARTSRRGASAGNGRTGGTGVNAGSGGAGGVLAPLGSGRVPKGNGMRLTQMLLLLAKQGFVETTPAALSDEARQALSRKVRPDQAVGIYQNPVTGEVRALVQDERQRERVSMLGWNGRAWSAMGG